MEKIQSVQMPPQTPLADGVKSNKTIIILNYIMLAFSIFGLGRTLLWLSTGMVRILLIAITVLGIVAFVMISKKKPVGLKLAVIWAGLQVLVLQVGSVILDFTLIPNFIYMGLRWPILAFEFNIFAAIFFFFIYREFKLQKSKTEIPVNSGI